MRMFSRKNKRKYIAILVVHDSENTYSVIKSISFNPMENVINFPIKEGKKSSEKPFTIDVSYPTYIRDNILYYMIEKNSGQILLHDSEKNVIDTDMLDDVLNNHIIRDLAKATSDKKKDWFSLITFLVIGTMIGFIIGFLIPYFTGG